MDKRLDTIERHMHVQLLEACARIDTNSTSFEYGRDCITAYHMRSGIDFAKAYSFPNYNNVGFCAAYETLCEYSQHLLYRYDFRLSCEALVSQMLFMRA